MGGLSIESLEEEELCIAGDDAYELFDDGAICLEELEFVKDVAESDVSFGASLLDDSISSVPFYFGLLFSPESCKIGSVPESPVRRHDRRQRKRPGSF